jgi:hypothetical protein
MGFHSCSATAKLYGEKKIFPQDLERHYEITPNPL